MKDALEPRKVVIYLFIIAIAVVFTLQFGPGSSGFGAAPTGAAPSAPAVVNGKEIPLMEFRREYVNQLQYLRSQGQPVSEAIARQFGLPQSVLDRMVNTELLAQAAERHGVKASDEEILKILQRDPSFQKDGQFDYATYQTVLRDYYRQTPAEYEEDIRRRLAAQKMLGIVQSGAVVSEDEVRTRFEKEGNQARIVFARFLPSMYAAKVPAPSAAELAAYKQAHEKEIKEYYEANRFVYQQPERIRARQILVKLAPDATPEAKAKAMERAQALRKEIVEGGKDFGEVAKASSEDPGTKPSGGDLGWVERNNWEPALANAAFALEPGQVTQPIETKFGVHLVKAEEKKPAQDKKLEEVQDEIATNLYKKDKAKELARAEAEKALAQVKAGKTITELFPPEKEQPALLRFETETRPEAVQTDTFNAASLNVPHLGPAPDLLTAVFASKGPQVLDQVFPVGEGFIIAQVTERQLADDTNFAQKKEELRKQAQQAKQYEVADSFLKSLRKSGTVVTNTTILDQVTGG